MLKLLTVGLFVFMLSGCGAAERLFASVVGGGASTCFQGVMYVQFTSGASVAYNRNGTVKRCD